MRRGAEWDWERVVPMLGKGGRTGKGPGYAVLHHVRAYWDGLRGTDLVPRRTLIEPHGLHDALAHVFLIERIAPGLARFRLAGTHMTNLMGMEVRGMPLSAILAPASRDGARALVEAVFAGPSIVELALESDRGLARPAVQGRMILLPVSGDDDVCDRALGCLVTEGDIGRGPRRFAITRQRTEMVLPPPRARLPEPAPRPAFAEDARAFSPPAPAPVAPAPGGQAPIPLGQPPRPPRGKPQLRIVRNDA
jgi:hypothetical protein